MNEATTIAAIEIGCGALLRQAREKLGMSLTEAAREVKMRINTLEALENEQWAQIGAPVFIRGQLRSYGRLLGVDVEPFLSRFEPQPSTSEILSATPGLATRDGHAGARMTSAVAIIAIIAALAWWLAQPSKSKLGASVPLAVTPAASVPAAPASVAPAAAVPAPGTVQAASATGASLSLDFSQDCWVQISTPDGKTLEQGTIPAGMHRNYKPGEVGKLVLGNASAIEVQWNGNKVDTTPFRRANVARFTVSSDGSLVAAGN